MLLKAKKVITFWEQLNEDGWRVKLGNVKPSDIMIHLNKKVEVQDIDKSYKNKTFLLQVIHHKFGLGWIWIKNEDLEIVWINS